MLRVWIMVLEAALLFAVSASAGPALDDIINYPGAASQNKEAAAPDRQSTGIKDQGRYLMIGSIPSEPYEDTRCLAVTNSNLDKAHEPFGRLAPLVYAYGRLLLVDPGQLKCAQEQKQLLSALSRSVVTLEGRNYDTKYCAVYSNWNTLRSMDFFDGRCQPYENIFMDRQIIFVKPWYWVVTDQVRTDYNGEHKTEQRWHLASSSVVLDEKTKTVSTGFNEGGNLQIIPLALGGAEVRQEKCCAALETGKKENTSVVIFERQEKAPVHYATVLRPYKGVKPSGRFETRFISPVDSADGDFTALSVKRDSGTDYIFISHNPDGKPVKMTAKEMSCKAKALRVTSPSNNIPPSFAWVDGSTLTVQGRKLASSSVTVSELDVRNDGAKVVITCSQAEPSLEVYVGNVKQAVINETDIVTLKPGQKYFKPFKK